MSSDSLQVLKSLPNAHKRVYKQYRQQLQQIVQIYAAGENRNSLVRQLQAKTKAELTALSRQRESATADIQRRAAARRVEATPEAKAKVAHALDHGWSVVELAQQLASEGDRAGLSALKDYLPYAARIPDKLPGDPQGGQLPGSPRDYTRQINAALESINVHEAQIWSDGEKRSHSEVREVGISEPLLAENEDRISKLVDRGLLSQGHKETVAQLFHWQGLPESPSERQGLFDPNQGD